MTIQDKMQVVEVPRGERTYLEPILEESFEGWYLRHAKGILRDVETVRVAMNSGEPLGLIMVKKIEQNLGYVYYIAVSRAHRKTGVAGLLLKDALDHFRASGVVEVFASFEEDNMPSEKLFESNGFARTTFTEVSSRHGTLRALNMYRMMVVVPGEVLTHKSLE